MTPSTVEINQWIAAASDPQITDVMLTIFEEASEAVRRERPLCLASGCCCRFEAHGHRLYVTGLEVAWFLRLLQESQGRSVTTEMIQDAQSRGDCPLLEDGMCSVHAIRPFGCRSYFCDPRATWQESLYEQWHERVRQLHEQHDIPYFYAEWRAQLLLVVQHELSA